MVEISTLPEETPREGDAVLFVRVVNGVPQAYKIDGSLVALTLDGSIQIGGVPTFSRDPASGNITISAPTVILNGPWPTEDPGIKGQLWENGGYLMISKGPDA